LGETKEPRTVNRPPPEYCRLYRRDYVVQLTNQVDPDGSSLTNEYYVTGELKKTSGSRTYPVGYSYDALGQVTSGKKYWSDGTPVAGQQFEYEFDDIGNRTSTESGSSFPEGFSVRRDVEKAGDFIVHAPFIDRERCSRRR
jgi:hypothetical protein